MDLAATLDKPVEVTSLVLGGHVEREPVDCEQLALLHSASALSYRPADTRNLRRETPRREARPKKAEGMRWKS